MFFLSRKKFKEKKDNEARLLKLNNREVRYVSARDPETNVEYVLGKAGIINIEDDEFIIMCQNKVVFRHSIKGLQGSELMSLDGIILSYTDENTGEYVEVIAYYKYYRRVVED